jgi:hypothetical protein
MMAVISAGGLGALMAWAQARVSEKGDLIIPCDREAHLDDFKAYVGKCPEVLEYDLTYIPGSNYAKAKLTLKPGHQLPTIAPRA